MKHDPSRKKKYTAICEQCGNILLPEYINTLAHVRCLKCKGGFYSFYVGDERIDLVPKAKAGGTGYYRFPKVEDLGTGKDRIFGRWTAVKGRGGLLEVYLSCPVCGGINDLGDNDIGAEGECECFHCASCGLDMYVTLDDWSPFDKMSRRVSRHYTVKGEAIERSNVDYDDNDDNYDDESPCDCDDCRRRRE